MAELKSFLFLILIQFLAFDCFHFAAIEKNLTDNVVQSQENAKIIAGNESLISPKRKTKKSIFKMNLTWVHGNDGKMAEQRDTSGDKKIKSGKMKFKIAKLLSKETATAASEIDTMESSENRVFEITTDNSGGVTAINQNQTLAKEKVLEKVERAGLENVEKKTQNKNRTPVKLNMKQGLIMNQILSTYGLSDVNNSLCKNHVMEFKLGLRALEPWAIKMFDASSKLMSGILGGNMAEMGSYTQCLNIYEETIYGPIKGQYCTLHVTPTDDLLKIILRFHKPMSEKHFQNLKNNVLDGVKLSWSVCVPDSCTYNDVFKHFNKSIVDVTEGLNLTISLSKEHCISVDDLPKLTMGDYIYMFCVGMVIVVVIISTAWDTIQIKDESPEVVTLFSLKRNATMLFSTHEGKNEISCLNGIRFLSTYSIVYGHRYVFNMSAPNVNSLDLVDWLETYYSTTVHGATTIVDTFLLLSSTLVSYIVLGMIAKGYKINIALYYLNRHLRLLVPLALAVATDAIILKHFGGGPLYPDFISYYQKTCGYFWWSTLLYIQPFVNPGAVCNAPTWSMSAEMSWFYLSPMIILTLAKNRKAGYMLLIALYTGTTVASFYLAWINEFDVQFLVSPIILQKDLFIKYYSQPIVRGGPYVLGLAFGYFLFQSKDQKVTMSNFTKTMGWILVSLCFPSVVLITRFFRLEGFKYNKLFASTFLTFHRSIWTLCIMWIIWCCRNGYGGLVNVILSWKPFKVLGRLGYTIYLFHFMFQGAQQSSIKTPSYFSNFNCVRESIGDMMIMIILTIPICLCFEYPFVRMCNLLFKPKNTKSKTTQVMPYNSKISFVQ